MAETTNDTGRKSDENLTGKLAVLARTMRGALLFFTLRVRYRALLRDARPLASHLEEEVFPRLARDKQEWLTLFAGEPGGELEGKAGPYEVTFPNTVHLAKKLRAIGVTRIRLDTRLENGQVIEAILTLLHAAAHFSEVQPVEEDYGGWSGARIASAMLSQEGLHRFCATMRYDPRAKTYEVAYTYCELFFSRLLQAYVEGGSRFNDHRLFFFLAPRLALAALVVALLPLGLLAWSATLVVVAVVPLAAAVAAAVFMAFYALGSVQYAREYHLDLIRSYTARVDGLSRFPETNPNLVFEIGSGGVILFTNPAVRRQLRTLAFSDDEASELLPDDYADLVDAALAQSPSTVEKEFHVHGLTLHYVLTSFPDEQSVIAVGADVTRLKNMEAQLRRLNNHLEDLVEERTEEVRNTQDVTILGLGALAELRDPETGAHLQRTRNYARALAIQLQNHPRFEDDLDREAIDHLYKSVPLHDIGKIGVPDSILRKPGQLTDAEYAEMKEHTRFGAEALERAEEQLGVKSFLSMAREIAYCHHERWDGTGYPEGMEGDAIPWPARLMALADVYDALRSRRYYKDPIPRDKVREMVVAEKGRHFDPDVVDAFLEIEDEFEAIAHAHQEEEAPLEGGAAAS